MLICNFSTPEIVVKLESRFRKTPVSRTTRSQRHRTSFADTIRQQLWLGIPLGVIALVLALGVINGQRERPGVVENFPVTSPGTPLPEEPISIAPPGEAIPTLEAIHIPPGETATYNSNPPTSGAHYAVAAPWGIHNQAPKDEALVHNLEHGGIIISYNPDQIGGQTLEDLRSQTRELSQINPRVVLTPRANLESAIALTAWGYLQPLDSYDASAVRAFYDAHIARRGPECQNGQCPG
jgi:hypothetical protein